MKRHRMWAIFENKTRMLKGEIHRTKAEALNVLIAIYGDTYSVRKVYVETVGTNIFFGRWTPVKDIPENTKYDVHLRGLWERHKPGPWYWITFRGYVDGDGDFIIQHSDNPCRLKPEEFTHFMLEPAAPPPPPRPRKKKK